ncbi:MAG: FAD/NAD(P)-binding protein [Candidatus Saganbacteria bacterium]|nr:FAD/NAD(P)-binding protein [Candidatus Saganbacteria bacterium]
MENLYKPVKARTEKVITETSNIKTFLFRPEKPLAFLPGQFMLVTVPGAGECAFTPSSDYRITETLEFTIMRAGSVTSLIHQLKAGDPVGLRGPYGKPYPLKDFHGKEIYVIGGGVGLAPLRALLYGLDHEIDHLKKVEVRFGARTPADIAYRDAIPQWQKRKKTKIVISVDTAGPGWTGNVGLVTTILEDDDVDPNNAVAVVCGPPIMMKFVNTRLLAMGFAPKNIYLSMEKNMSCGIGKCFHCNLGKYFVCKDGPVFTWEQIKDIPEPW